jgi:hypothetical protein
MNRKRNKMSLEEVIKAKLGKSIKIDYPVKKEPYKKYKSGSKLNNYKPEDPKSGNGSSGAPAALYM